MSSDGINTKKRLVIYSVIYYALVPSVFFVLMYLASAAIRAAKAQHGLAAVFIGILVFVYLAVPVADAVMMRFSPLKFYVDPLAAAEIPLLIFALMVRQFSRSGSFRTAFYIVNEDLADDGGIGCLVLIGLFIFGLLFSFSIKRKNGQSIAYRIIAGKRSLPAEAQ